jgi:hypothetical protein
MNSCAGQRERVSQDLVAIADNHGRLAAQRQQIDRSTRCLCDLGRQVQYACVERRQRGEGGMMQVVGDRVHPRAGEIGRAAQRLGFLRIEAEEREALSFQRFDEVVPRHQK